jgi:hypothetical protein
MVSAYMKKYLEEPEQKASVKKVSKVVVPRAGDLQPVDDAGLAAVQKKTRTAAPSLKADVSAGGPPEKPPGVKASVGAPGGRKTFLVTIPILLDKRLEATRAKRGLRSRNEIIVALLDEGAAK